jgi:urea ABC transporter ATP-binding protein UrtE
MTKPMLTISGLRGGYGGKPVLQGVDLTVGEGEIVAVIGRNGVGKTTLMKSLIGLLPASSGSILFKGENIGRLEAHHRARLGLGYVPQGREVFPRMTVEENLIVGYRGPAGERAQEFERIYGIFPILAERRTQRAGTMSGGQQQQLAIGRVLVGRPDVILLDEPSEGIQPSIVEEIGEVMKRINLDTSLTVIFVEQNLDLIRSMAQRCYVMDKGRIIAAVTPEELDDRETVRRYLSV